MSTQAIYTPAKAAQMIGCTESQVLDHIRGGRIKAAFMENIANYVITHDDLLAFLKASKNFQTVAKMVVRRVLLIDRNPVAQDVLRMDLPRAQFEVRVATSPREVSVIAGEYRPDVICVHLGAVARSKDPLPPALVRARAVSKCPIILYHDFTPTIVASPEMLEHIQGISPDVMVTIDKGMRMLVEAIRGTLGFKAAASGVKRRTTTVRRPQSRITRRGRTTRTVR